jgi:ABC-type transporter Mla maintaining outer membrane lipid asymmetry permease subunit MlaE
VRTHTIFTVLLSFDALYLPLLDIIVIAVALYLGGMAIAEDILRVAHATFISRTNFALSGDRLASGRHRSNGADLFSRLRHDRRRA